MKEKRYQSSWISSQSKYFRSAFSQLTYDDGVNFALDLQGGVVAAEDVDHLLQLRLLDRQVVCLLKVFLQRQGDWLFHLRHWLWWKIPDWSLKGEWTFDVPPSTSSPPAPAEGVFSGPLLWMSSRSQETLSWPVWLVNAEWGSYGSCFHLTHASDLHEEKMCVHMHKHNKDLDKKRWGHESHQHSHNWEILN